MSFVKPRLAYFFTFVFNNFNDIENGGQYFKSLFVSCKIVSFQPLLENVVS